MHAEFKCPKCGKVDKYVMQDDVVIIKDQAGNQIWKLYCHFCGADMDNAKST